MPMRKRDLRPAGQAGDSAIAAGTYVKREKPLELPSESHDACIWMNSTHLWFRAICICSV